jgi:hypothetical protein
MDRFLTTLFPARQGTQPTLRPQVKGLYELFQHNRLQLHGSLQQLFECSTPPAVGEESEVSDANQAAGQNVKQESAQEPIPSPYHISLFRFGAEAIETFLKIEQPSPAGAHTRMTITRRLASSITRSSNDFASCPQLLSARRMSSVAT